MIQMRRLGRMAAHLWTAWATLLGILMPTSRYDWVSDVDPTISPADLIGGGDDSALAIGTFAILGLLVEAVALTTGRTRRERIVPALLIVVLGGAWLARFAV